MQQHQFACQRQSDAGAFVRTRSSAFDAMEAVEEIRNLLWRDADAGVTDSQMDRTLDRAQLDADTSLKGVLEGVGEQVQYDFFPHVAVNEDRFGQGWTRHRQDQAATLDRRAKAAGQFRG